MHKLKTYDVFTKSAHPNNIIGWRKTRKEALSLAGSCLRAWAKTQKRPTVVIRERLRRQDDFSY